jgi:uncharacterized membrane protein YccF (DUF307 family)
MVCISVLALPRYPGVTVRTTVRTVDVSPDRPAISLSGLMDHSTSREEISTPPGERQRFSLPPPPLPMARRSLPVRALWFLAVGWWLTPILVNIAWALNATVVLLPVGIKLINLVPTALTLAEPRSLSAPEAARGQRSLFVRAVYFLLVGWWLSLVWANVATAFALSVIGLPVAFWMLNRLPFVTSLYRFHG